MEEGGEPHWTGSGRPPRVFVCYGHDNEDHRHKVGAFAEFLVRYGIDVRIDVWHEGRRRDWQVWATQQITRADFILVVASPLCKRIGEGDYRTGERRGLRSEMNLIRELYNGYPDVWPERILPVILPGSSTADIPLFLQPMMANHYTVDAFTAAGANDLLDHIFERPPRQRPPLGQARRPDRLDEHDAAGLARRALDASAGLRSRLEAREVAYGIPRTDVVTAVLAALAGALPGETRIVPVRGVPGAGKTVIAGQIAAALAEQHDDRAVLIVVCESITGTPRDADEFDRAFGQVLTVDAPLTSVISTIRRQGRPVTLILDTVDCVLDWNTRATLVEMMHRVQRAGADLVFTCRLHDHNVLLKTERQLGPLVRYIASPVDVPDLTPQQVTTITVAFLERRGIEPPGGREPFARQVNQLAAGETRLVEIVTNPLLLVMLCQLFAPTGAVPPDMTTARLCVDYCQKTVGESRKYPDDKALLHGKRRIWQLMAGMLWSSSGQLLHLDIPRPELVAEPDDERAFDDLCSEGFVVPKSLDGGRVGFLHQIIAEYSIAIYLRDRSGDELDTLLDRLRRDPNRQLWAWQIVRHLIAIADRDGAQRLLRQLDLQQEPAYRAAVLGAAAEWRPGLLLQLAQDPTSVDYLCEATLCVPDEALGEALRALAQAARSRPAEALAAFRHAGKLLARLRRPSPEETLDLVSFIAARQRESDEGRRLADDLIRHLFDPVVALRSGPLPPEVLAAARALLSRADSNAARSIIRVHEPVGTAAQAQRDLCERLLRHDRADTLKDHAAGLIASVAPWRAPDAETTSGDLVRFLEGGHIRSGKLRAAAVAQAAARSSEMVAALIDALVQAADDRTAERLLIALQETVKGGAAEQVAGALAVRPVPAAPGGRGRLMGLSKTFATQPPALRQAVADWLRPALGTGDNNVIDTNLRLVRDDEERFRAAAAHLSRLPTDQARRIQANLLRELTGAEVAVLRALLVQLDESEPADGVFHARLVAKMAEEDEPARAELIELAADPARLTSAQAITHLLTAARTGKAWLTAHRLLPFAREERYRSRLGMLQITVVLVRAGREQDVDAVVVAWLDAAHRRHGADQPIRPAEAGSLLELAHAYLRDGAGRGGVALAAVRDVVEDIIATTLDDAAVLKELLALIKTGVWHADRSALSWWAGRLLAVLQAVDLAAVSDGPAFARDAAGRLIQHEHLAVADLVAAARRWSPTNLVMLVDVVVRHDLRGKDSPLLDEIMRWSPAEPVRQAIWRHRM
jgi:hypothetical protein